MNTKDEFFDAYVACDQILNSKSAESDEKTAAWRQQILLANHLTRDLPPSMQLSIFRAHMNKLNPNTHSEFIEQRTKAVDSLLGGYTPIASNSSSIEILDVDFDTLCEAPCRGVYESCMHWELKDSCLKHRNQEQPNSVFKKRDAFLFDKNVQMDSDESIKHQKPKTIENKSFRNTLTSYFPQRQLPDLAPLSKMESSKKFQYQQSQEQLVKTSADSSSFRTAREELILQNMKKFGDPNGRNNSENSSYSENTPLFNYGATKKSLGARRNVRSGFVPPVVRADDANTGAATTFRTTPPSGPGTPNCTPPDVEPVDERLVNIDPKMIELITNEIMHKYKPIDWSDIAGLEYAKSIIKEAVVYPLLRPDIFTGLRRPPRGILLFGPPGTGKTLIGKCIASKSQSTFFSISASSLTSKWIGDGEKMVRALFAVAAVHQPSVVFIDEIDSLLSQRSTTEHESSRRLKTEFLVQLDGATTTDDDRILIVGATNRPQELDEAARRRLVRRLYIPLPELEARVQILKNLLKTVRNNITQNEINEIGKLTVGYSGADMESLCREASMEPIRSIPPGEIPFFSEEKVRPIVINDFIAALHKVRPSVSQEDLKQYTEWDRIYGAGK